MQRLLNEPALISGAVNTGLLALLAFGFSLTEQQIVAVMAFVNAILSVMVRAVVTPNQLAEHRVEMGYAPTERIPATAGGDATTTRRME